MFNNKKNKELLFEKNLFFYASVRGSFILLPQGYVLWQNIQKELDKKFAVHGIQNVLLPTLIPLSLFSKEKEHIEGFNPECYYIEKIGNKKLLDPLILRPTSETAFYYLYSKILFSYKQLPLLYNQWCSVFRNEKNISVFFRNTEFYWQEGHTIHISENEARKLVFDILDDYKWYVKNILCLANFSGRKTEEEKFKGALETYSIECLLPDKQCLQLATSHYFGNNFCKLMNVKFQNKENIFQYPFSTSWGTSTRAIGAITKTHNDENGIIFPFFIAPIQIAFVLITNDLQLFKYYQEINNLISTFYRCKLYNNNSQFNLNIKQADQEGCPIKIILGLKEMQEKNITLIRRNNNNKKYLIFLEKDIKEDLILIHNNVLKKIIKERKDYDYNIEKYELEELIKKEIKKNKIKKIIEEQALLLNKNLYQNSLIFLKKNIYEIKNYEDLNSKIKINIEGLFLISFCNEIECEKNIKNKIKSYSIRCIKENIIKDKIKCLFCQSLAKIIVYLGRSK